MKRWKCPACTLGRNAPDTLDGEDSRGYCFACSEKSGRLVRMIIPVVANAKVKRAEKRKAKTRAKRDAQAHREWERLHTWPGVRELRWNRWAVRGVRVDVPRPRNATTIEASYAELFRLGLPYAAPYSTTIPAAVRDAHTSARDRFLGRIGIDDEIREVLKHDHDPKAFNEVYRYCKSHAIDWLIEDLLADGGGAFDETGRQAIIGVASRADLSSPNDVKSLNTIILNAFALAVDVNAGDVGDDEPRDNAIEFLDASSIPLTYVLDPGVRS